MMNGRGKSDSAIVAGKPTNKAGQPAAEFGGAKCGGRGECEPAKHAPGAGPEKCVTGAGAHTASRKATEEGTVHLALPSYHPRTTPVGVLRPQARCRTGCGWADPILGDALVGKQRFDIARGQRTPTLFPAILGLHPSVPPQGFSPQSFV